MRTRTTTLAASLVATLMIAAAGSLAGAAAPARGAPDPGRPLPLSRLVEERTGVQLRHGPAARGRLAARRVPRPREPHTHPDLDTNPINLPARSKQKYGWRVCRSWNSVSNAYRVVSTLSRGNWSRFEVNELEAPFIHGEGNYEWGGRLAFVEPPGQTHPAG
jgi:hypothetical protein